MTLIVCLDDRNGMMFNKRRQSQDSVLRARVIKASSESKLWMSPYSAKQFEPDARIEIDENYQRHADKNDFCFVEDMPISLRHVDRIIIYRWNRHYPADKHFDIDLDKKGFKLISTDEFAGSSHEKITEDIYELSKQPKRN
jgi:hypothetical protein